jgi:hypothetical protein
MKKLFATLLAGFFLIQFAAHSYNVEMTAAYDHFRGLPDGSWNGNNGAVVTANISSDIWCDLTGQIGVSYGLYNWDGRENLVFDSPQCVLNEAFVTAGLGYTYRGVVAGIVYDRIFTDNFGINNLTPTFDQLRLKAGYEVCREEIGIWGTVHLETAHRTSIGIPITFRAVDQVNFYWTHNFANCAKTTVWAGLPYRCSLMYPGRIVGSYILGFAAKAPLTRCLYLDTYGSYMGARNTTPLRRSRCYASNISLGFTYYFNEPCFCNDTAVMPVANNSNFLIDTNCNN